MRDYSQLIAKMASTPWLIEKASLEVMLDIVNRHLRGDKLDDETIRLRIQENDHGDREHERIEIGGGVGVVPIYGPIFPKANLMTEVSGATSLEQVKSDIQSLLNNERVEHIVLDIDSPGGSADMIQEAGDFIRWAKAAKPITAVANSMAASGAYWLGSQASSFFGTDSAKVGSVGVYFTHTDRSEQLKSEGLKITHFYAGEFKTAGNDTEPLTDKAKEYIQEHVDETYEGFVDAVATGRRLDREYVKSNIADGRVFSAKKAMELGMIDGIKTMDNVLDGLLAENSGTNGYGALSGAMARYSNGTDMKLEHVDMEHSEPGTGNPPTPREQEKDTIEMTRIPTPPIAFEEEQMESLLDRLRASLPTLGEDATEDDVIAAVEAQATELATANEQMGPLLEVDRRVNESRAFAENYPEHAARLERLEKSDREHEAKEFAGTFHKFKTEEGTESTSGYSAIVLQMIENAHLAVSNKSFTHEMLGELLMKIGNAGVVDYGEKGSAREPEEGSQFEGANARMQFTNAVKHYMEEDTLDFEAAVKVAADKHPELYQAYRNAPVTQKVS